MLAVLKALRAYKNKEVPIINNPVLFDASCSGIQHLSAMTRDIEIARKVNIIPEQHLENESDEMILEKSTGQDYYLYAAKKVQVYLDNCKDKKFNNILLSRELVKRTIMTIPYNVTAFGVKGQLLKHIKLVKIDDKMFYQLTPNLTKDNKTMFLLPSEFLKFVDVIYKNLVDIPSLSKLTKYLNKLLKIILKLDIPII
jgi:DNA-directed RNA polymerase